MNLPRVFQRTQTRTITLVAIAAGVAIFIVNLLKLGGDAFIFLLNSNLNFPLSILVTIAAASIWGSMSNENRRRRLWLHLFLGWGAWAVAETYWAVAAILGQEVPYPSFADFFWVIGYVPILVGVVGRIREIPTHPTRRQWFLIGSISGLVLIATTVLILVPIIRFFDASALVESILNLLYPLVDVVLIIFVLRLFFTYEKGDYGFVWQLLALGFISMTISDLIFAYANLGEFYYPEMQANLVSRLFVDVPYTFAYLLWLIAIFAFRAVLRQESYDIVIRNLDRVPVYGHILVYTNHDDTALDTSRNYSRLFAATEVRGMHLKEVLTLNDEEARVLVKKLHQERRVADLPMRVRDRFGIQRPVELSGVAIFNSEGGYMGANLLLRVATEDRLFDQLVNEEDRAMTRYLLRESGGAYHDTIKRFLVDYHVDMMRTLISIIEIEGGELMVGAVIQEMRRLCDNNGWQISVDGERILDGSPAPLEEVRQALPVLLRCVRDFAAQVSDPETVERHLQEMAEKISPEVQLDLERFMSPGSEIRFADGG